MLKQRLEIMKKSTKQIFLHLAIFLGMLFVIYLYRYRIVAILIYLILQG